LEKLKNTACFSIRLAVSWSQRLEKSLTLLTQAETADAGEKKTSGKAKVTKKQNGKMILLMILLLFFIDFSNPNVILLFRQVLRVMLDIEGRLS
jgi:hypothetical protein